MPSPQLTQGQGRPKDIQQGVTGLRLKPASTSRDPDKQLRWEALGPPSRSWNPFPMICPRSSNSPSSELFSVTHRPVCCRLEPAKEPTARTQQEPGCLSHAGPHSLWDAEATWVCTPLSSATAWFLPPGSPSITLSPVPPLPSTLSPS